MLVVLVLALALGCGCGAQGKQQVTIPKDVPQVGGNQPDSSKK
jgi:hypothetical protein